MPFTMSLNEIRALIRISQAFPAAKPIFTAVGVLLLVCIFSNTFVPPVIVITLQAAKDVRASQDALFGIFECLEAFFQRLEIYTGAALDQKMLETVTKIMVEVLNIIGIATKEIKQGRASRYSLYK